MALLESLLYREHMQQKWEVSFTPYSPLAYVRQQLFYD